MPPDIQIKNQTPIAAIGAYATPRIILPPRHPSFQPVIDSPPANCLHSCTQLCSMWSGNKEEGGAGRQARINRFDQSEARSKDVNGKDGTNQYILKHYHKAGLLAGRGLLKY